MRSCLISACSYRNVHALLYLSYLFDMERLNDATIHAAIIDGYGLSFIGTVDLIRPIAAVSVLAVLAVLVGDDTCGGYDADSIDRVCVACLDLWRGRWVG